jgi:Phosphoesterase family
MAAAMLASAALAANDTKQPEALQEESSLARINHIVVTYQENHSFDNYLGTFPGADGIAASGAAATQTDKQGQAYASLPVPLANAVNGVRMPHPRFPAELANGPFLLNDYVTPEDGTANMVHAFYRQQYQINGGRMDHFIAWTDAGGLVMGYWDLRGSPLYELGREFAVADRFFMGAFGGSFLNHQWLICACTPVFPNAPAEMIAAALADDPEHVQDRQVSPDGYVINHEAANPSYSVNGPLPANARPELLIPSQTAPTIGDRLTEAGIDWVWYAGGWTDALAGNPDPRFQFHHQPFVYYDNYAAETPGRTDHLKDETEFFAALDEGRLPAVSFVKPMGLDNEHPAYATVARPAAPGPPGGRGAHQPRVGRHARRHHLRRQRRPVGPCGSARHRPLGPWHPRADGDRLAGGQTRLRRPHDLRHDIDPAHHRGAVAPRAARHPGRGGQRPAVGPAGRPWHAVAPVPWAGGCDPSTLPPPRATGSIALGGSLRGLEVGRAIDPDVARQTGLAAVGVLWLVAVG